jgi:hypothetical protein
VGICHNFHSPFSWSQFLFLLAEIKAVTPDFPREPLDLDKQVDEELRSTFNLLLVPRCRKILELIDQNLKDKVQKLRINRIDIFNGENETLDSNSDIAFPCLLFELPEERWQIPGTPKL